MKWKPISDLKLPNIASALSVSISNLAQVLGSAYSRKYETILLYSLGYFQG